MRTRIRRDRNHVAIAAHLKAHGVEVIDLAAMGTVPDLLITYRGYAAFLECKVEGSRAKWYARQLKFIRDTHFPVAIVKSPEEAFQVVRDRKYLTRREKDAIGAMLAVAPKDSYQPSEVEGCLE